MTKFLPAGVALAMLAACGSNETTVSGEDGGTMTYSTDDAGNLNADITTDKGEQLTVRSGGEANLPDGFTLYPGATMQGNSDMKGPQGTGAMMTLESDASPEKVVAFYKKQAEDAGYDIQSEVRSGDMQMIVAQKPSAGGALSVMAQKKDGGSEITLTHAQNN